MAVPNIIPVVAVPFRRQGERFVFQPYATNSPTSWSISTPPPGLTLSTVLGTLSGAVTEPGVYLFALTASNADGASVPQIYALSVEATTAYATSDLTELIVDLVTGAVRSAYEIKLPLAKDAGDPGKPDPVGFAKTGDVRLFDFRLERNAAGVNLPVTGLKLTFKDLEPEAQVAASATMAWSTITTGTVLSYRVAVDFGSDALQGIMSNHEGDDATQFVALVELEWQHANNLLPLVGPETLRSSSQSFGLLLAREQTPN